MKDKLKYIPAIVSLMAGLVASIVTIISRYDTLNIMIITLVSLLVFYIAGIIVKFICEKNFVIEETDETADEEAAEGDTDEDAVDEEKEKSEGEQTDDNNLNE